MGKIVVTTNEKRIIVIHYDDSDELLDIRVLNSEDSLVGSIFRGKVCNVVKNLNACFVSISPSVKCFLPQKECINEILPKVGDEITIQVIRDAIKTKEPSATMKISQRGHYLVLKYQGDNCTKKKVAGVSSKIENEDERRRLKELMASFESGNYSVIARTSCKNITYDKLCYEYEHIKDGLDSIIKNSTMRTVYSCLSKNAPSLIKSIQELSCNNDCEIITDDSQIFDILSDNLSDNLKIKIKYYEDNKVSLYTLYSIGKIIDELTSKKVWLNCGGYLIIEQTEAMNVIDVNSGKCVAAKTNNELINKVNMEAAKEIARQIRLRNLSGIIVVDFINPDKCDLKDVTDILEEYFKLDSARPVVVDITKLSLVEITRKCTTKSLLYQIN